MNFRAQSRKRFLSDLTVLFTLDQVSLQLTLVDNYINQLPLASIVTYLNKGRQQAQAQALDTIDR